jgi:hypothetical protein
MQISNSVISQYLNNTVNRSQQPDQFPVKHAPRSEPIEGQLVDDEKKQSQTNPSVLDSGGSSFNKDLEQSGTSSQTQLIAPATTPQLPQEITSDSIGNSLLIQKKLSSKLSTPSQNDSSQGTHTFPYGNRRSFEGLSGGSLVIQKYLNNESPSQSDNSQKNVDIFI